MLFPVCVDDFKPDVSYSILMTRCFTNVKVCLNTAPHDHVSSCSLCKYISIYIDIDIYSWSFVNHDLSQQIHSSCESSFHLMLFDSSSFFMCHV